MADEYVYGATAAVTVHNGVKVRVKIDEPWLANDPFVKARPDLFKGFPERVQDTTDTPVSKRAAKRTAK